ncbi:MAG: hypothetical protein O2794_00860 [bacterium]|nr:hypothetical protein [bacterium]
MTKHIHWGIVLVFIYLLAIVGLFIYALSCDGFLCGLLVVWAAAPWSILAAYTEIEGNALSGALLFFGGIVINIFILYFTGKLLSKKKVASPQDE